MSTILRTEATVTISKEHPAFAGHFPGTPILPGVLLLDETLRALESGAAAAAHWRIASAKFLKPVGPGEQLRLEHEALPTGSLRFSIYSGESLVATGTLVPAQTRAGDVRAE